MEYMTLSNAIKENNTGLDAIQRAPIVEYKTNHRCLRIQNVSHQEPFELWGFTEVSDTNFKKFQLKKDDIIISRTGGSIGTLLFIDEDKNAVYNNGLIRLKTTSEFLPEFIYYCLSTDMFSKYVEKCCLGNSTQENIRMDDLLKFKIPNINLIEQEKIVTRLKNIDKQIERNNDMVQKLQVLATSTYSRWFNQFEFPNEDGLPYKTNGGKFIYNEKLKRNIPIGWEVKELSDILKESDKSQIQVGEAKQNIGTYPFFTNGEEIVLYKDAFVNGAYCYLNTGGNADVKFFDGKASYSTDTWCISFDEYTYIMKEYLQSIKPLMDKLFFSGSGLKHLQKEAFKKQKVLIPPLNLVLAYNDIVSDCQKQASKIYMQNIELNQLKSKLLPLLINGQLEV